MTLPTPAVPPARVLLLALAAANFAVGLGAFVVVGVLSPVATGFGITKADAGALMTIYAIVYAISSPLAVAFTGAWDRARVLLVGLGLFALGAGLAAAAPSFTVLLAARVLMALGGGLLTPVAATVAVAGTAPEQRGRALATVFGGLTLAQAIGVPVGAWLGYAFGWRTAFEVVAAVTVIVAVVLWRTLPRGLQVPRTDLAALGRVLANLPLLTAVAFTGLFIGGLYVVYTFLAPLVEARYGLGRDGVAAVLLVFGLGAVVGNALGGQLTDRIGPVRTLLWLTAAQMILMPVLTLLPLPLAAGVAVIAAWSVFAWSFMVAQQARLAALSPAQVPVLFALNAAAIYVGASLGSALGGATLRTVGEAGLGPVGAALMLMAAASVAWVQRIRA